MVTTPTASTNKQMMRHISMKMRKMMFILLSLFTSSVFGQENKSGAGGPPTLSELKGFWKKVELPNEEIKSS
jgi:hypothetical protein